MSNRVGERVISRDAELKLGNRVRVVRITRGVSQERLGDMLGVTFQQIQKYEKGTNRISTTRMMQIAKVLEAPLSAFVDDDHETTPVQQTVLTPPEQQMLTNFRLLNSDQRRSVSQIIAALCGNNEG